MSQLGRLLLVTDRRAAEAANLSLEEALARALAALPSGAALVQLREKDLGAGALLALAQRLVPLCRAHACPLVINDRLDVALAAGADGVHLPERGLPVRAARRAAPAGFLIGASVHSAAAAAAAAAAGADLVVCGPVHDTPSKRSLGQPIGLGELEAASRALAGTDTRLYAIGGLTPERTAACLAAGAHGIAAIRAWLTPDPARATAALAAATA